MNAIKTALLAIDLQNDFLPGGALAVQDGDQVVPVANRLMSSCVFDLIVATKDWHPADHGSFAANHAGKSPGDVITLGGQRQVLWPTHCVQETTGGEFAPGLATECFDHVIRKGQDPLIDSYSGFFDNGHRKSTGLGDYLTQNGVTDVYIIGLATDYCVKFTALDGIELGLNVHLIADASRGVNLRPGDVDRAIEEMKAKGVRVIVSDDVVGQALCDAK